MTELPRWKCHKIVHAAKIAHAYKDGDQLHWALAVNAGEPYWSIPVSDALRRRVLPEGTDCSGGYYVRYEDGYESWSPAKAFEEGYMRLVGEPPALKPHDFNANGYCQLCGVSQIYVEDSFVSTKCPEAKMFGPGVPPVPADMRGILMAATLAEFAKVSIEIEPGLRQIWIRGETVPD